jgi:hypothetical protein
MAQSDSVTSIKSSKHPKVQLRTRAQKDRILLRWAVDEPYAWKQSALTGFMVERMTVMQDSQRIKKPTWKRLTLTPLVPKPKEDWLKAFEKIPQAAIIAQCLFGESLEIKTDMNHLFKEKEALEQRFTFALMAADQSFEAASLAGWAYTDIDVKSNEKYVYRVTAALPKKVLAIDTAFAFVALSDYAELPKPLDLQASFGVKKVMLSWDYALLAAEYASYFVEKSEDSTTFARAVNLPVMVMNTPENGTLSRMYFTDSLETTDKKFFYRVRGITCFGEVSPPSEVIWGTGRERMSFAPNITDFKIQNDSTVALFWTLPEDSLNVLLQHFELSRSNTSETGYVPVVPKISKAERMIVFKGLQPSNYFTIAAVDRYGEKYVSFPQLVQPIDSTPPAIPTGLEGFVNDSGVVQLTWVPNKETDIYGYHIYKGNIATEEFALITRNPIQTAAFTDSVDLKMLNSKTYYKIAALDRRFNQSAPSKVLILDKPDHIPPITPQFTDFKLEEGKVKLIWENSPSEDVFCHRLYRLDPNLGQWKLLKEFKGADTTTFSDVETRGGLQVSYTLVAVDKSRNESPPSAPITVTVPVDKRNRPAVRDLRALVDRKSAKVLIDWLYEEREVVEFQIYRAFAAEAISLWQVLKADKRGLVDDKLIINNIYRYAVRAVFSDGSMSTWKEVKINY